MICPKSLRMAHEEVQKNIFAMIPEKWDRLYLYASITDHFNNLQTGEMFFFYYPKGVLKKNPINVYEVPVKFNLDENQYFKLADELFNSIKKLRLECQEQGEELWTNLTISIEKLKYRVEYSYDDLNSSEFDSDSRHLIWEYTYLDIPYESLNKKERNIINEYLKLEKKQTKIFELPLYDQGTYQKIESVKHIEKNLKFVTDKKIEEMKFINTYVPKSQILNKKN